MNTFSTQDITQIKAHQLTTTKVNEDLDKFKSGFKNLNLIRPASISDGIFELNEERIKHYTKIYNNDASSKCKFVPASGAATRMFKDLHSIKRKYDDSKSLLENLEDLDLNHMSNFFKRLEDLPFAETILKDLKLTAADLSKDANKLKFITYALNEDGLNFSNTPKALIPFHNYGEDCLTAFEEHFYEAAEYASVDGVARLHFTITEKHQEKFDEALANFLPKIESETGIKYEVSFSYQLKSTDTIAVNLDFSFYRDADERLLFRPAGHGALLQNLNQVESDFIFIKNIDNVSFNPLQNTQELSGLYKKVLAGVCIDFKSEISRFISELQNNPSDSIIKQSKDFLIENFNSKPQVDTVEALIKLLDRPIRVCGMVKNEGDPGGGPFWVKLDNGEETLQIVEKSQIDLENKHQVEQFEASTHFNPVDIVCTIKNRYDETYNLQKYVDHSQGFVAKKSVNGKPIKGLELPGLWNGSMALWHTVFVEVPQYTFNPVKSVADLLKPHHQTTVDVE